MTTLDRMSDADLAIEVERLQQNAHEARRSTQGNPSDEWAATSRFYMEALTEQNRRAKRVS